MAVYVDNFTMGKFRGHLGADTHEELIAMVDAIGLSRRWIQKPGTPYEHFDVMAGTRARAVRAGAIEVDPKEWMRRVVFPKKRELAVAD